jgi:hypothetical protein
MNRRSIIAKIDNCLFSNSLHVDFGGLTTLSVIIIGGSVKLIITPSGVEVKERNGVFPRHLRGCL